MSINPPPPQYKGAPLDPARGPGLGCFWLQIAILAVFVVLTPIGVLNGWALPITVGMLVVVLVLLFFVGQTAIFLLRLVSADRRSRRRPLASRTPTVGELEDAADRSGDTQRSAESTPSDGPTDGS